MRAAGAERSRPPWLPCRIWTRSPAAGDEQRRVGAEVLAGARRNAERELRRGRAPSGVSSVGEEEGEGGGPDPAAGVSSAEGGGPVPAPRSWARDLPASGTARAAAGLDGVLGAALLGAAAWIWVCLSVGAEICRS